MSGKVMMCSHKNSTLRRKHSSCSWKQWCCLIVTIYCCLNHSAYGQLPSALTSRTTTTTRPKAPAAAATIATTTSASAIISTTKRITPRVIVESIALDENKKRINAAGNDEAHEKVATEILQLPHAFRHQQHYSHRIEQAVNDFKQQHQPKEHIEQQKQQESQLKERDKIYNNKNKKYIISNDKISTRYHHHHQQQSAAQWQDQQHHQRRHEHHTTLQQQQPLYHLRHRNHYAAAWEKQSIPTLRHQHHRTYNITTAPTRAILQQATTEAGIELEDNVDNGHDHLGLHAVGSILLTANVTSNMRRYFDREALYRRQPVTKSPINRKPFKWPSIESKKILNNSPDSMNSDTRNGLSGKRLTLKMQDKQENFSSNFANNLTDDDDDNVNDEDGEADDDDDDDENDDYSYQQTEEDFFMSHELATNEQHAEKWNNFPTSKPPVKRFTNPFRNLFKSLRGNEATNQKENKNNDEDIADEKYRMRVQQHHIRQQQHQQELEAMRSWHGGIAANMFNSGLNKHTTNSNGIGNHNHQASFSSRLTNDLLPVN